MKFTILLTTMFIRSTLLAADRSNDYSAEEISKLRSMACPQFDRDMPNIEEGVLTKMAEAASSFKKKYCSEEAPTTVKQSEMRKEGLHLMSLGLDYMKSQTYISKLFAWDEYRQALAELSKESQGLPTGEGLLEMTNDDWSTEAYALVMGDFMSEAKNVDVVQCDNAAVVAGVQSSCVEQVKNMIDIYGTVQNIVEKRTFY